MLLYVSAFWTDSLIELFSDKSLRVTLDVRTSIRGFLTRAQLKVLFDELEKEMEEEELLAELEEAPRLDLGPGPIPTIMEESSRLSGVSSLQPEASAVRSPLQANPSRSRLQVQSAQAGAEGEKPLDYPSSSALNEEPSLPRRVINERLTQSRRDLFRQVTNARSTGAIVDVESLIKKHQDARFPARASLTSTSTPPSGLEPSPVSSDIPRNPHRALSPEDSESEQPARQSLRSYDESEDHPSSHVTLDGLHSSPTGAAPLLPSLHEEEDEVEGKEGEEALQPQSQTREESQVTPSGDQADANAGKPGRGLSLVLEYIESPRNE